MSFQILSIQDGHSSHFSCSYINYKKYQPIYARVKRMFRSLESWLKVHTPGIHLRPGATEEQLDDIESMFSFCLFVIFIFLYSFLQRRWAGNYRLRCDASTVCTMVRNSKALVVLVYVLNWWMGERSTDRGGVAPGGEMPSTHCKLCRALSSMTGRKIIASCRWKTQKTPTKRSAKQVRR